MRKLHRGITLWGLIAALLLACAVAAQGEDEDEGRGTLLLRKGYVTLFNGRVHLGDISIHSKNRVCNVEASQWTRIEWLGSAESGEGHRYRVADWKKRTFECDTKATVCLQMVEGRQKTIYCTLPLNAKPVGEHTDRMRSIILY